MTTCCRPCTVLAAAALSQPRTVVVAPRQRGHGAAAGRSRLLRPALAAPAQAASRATTPAADEESDDPSRDFASSLALMVLGAALISERLNGKGLVAMMELDHPHVAPLLWGIAGGLAVAAAWPAKRNAATAVGKVRQLAGRAAFAGLAATLGIELYTGLGLLAMLDFETGAESLTEAETGLAVLVMLVLTGPRRRRQ